MKNVRTAYYEATHNNFLMTDCVSEKDFDVNKSKLVSMIQTKKLDSCLVLLPSNIGIRKMLVLEKDGSISAMCGNGIRAVAKYLYDTEVSVSIGDILVVEILTGTIHVEILSHDAFKVSMGEIKSIDIDKTNFLDLNILLGSNRNFKKIDFLLSDAKLFSSAGEPHVVLEANFDDINIEELFYRIQNSEFFPEGVNLNVIKKISDNEISNITFERGVNAITQSCGTGSTSSAEYVFQKYNISNLDVINKGGTLKFKRDEEGNFICSGPANLLPKDYI